MGLHMADEDDDKKVKDELSTDQSNDKTSGVHLDEIRDNTLSNLLHESNRRNSLPPGFPDNANVQRLCGQILRVIGDDHFSKTCGRHLRCMGDEISSFYWVRQQMLKKQNEQPQTMSNSRSLPDLTHPRIDQS